MHVSVMVTAPLTLEWMRLCAHIQIHHMIQNPVPTALTVPLAPRTQVNQAGSTKSRQSKCVLRNHFGRNTRMNMHSSLGWQAEYEVAYHVAIASRHMCATWRSRNVKAGQRGAPGRRRCIVHDVHLAQMFCGQARFVIGPLGNSTCEIQNSQIPSCAFTCQ